MLTNQAAALGACLFLAAPTPSLSAEDSLVSPYRLSAGRELAFALPGAALYGLSVFIGSDRLIDSAFVAGLDAADIRPAFDRPAARRWSESAALLSDAMPVVLAAGVLIMPWALEPPGAASRRSIFRTVLVMYSEAWLINEALKRTVKRATGRTRPLLYNDAHSTADRLAAAGNDADESFYSGHTSAAFMSAVFLSKVFSDLAPRSRVRYAVWGLSLAAAVCTGYLRYRAGRHFPSDIFAGAAAGSAIGYIVPHLHRAKSGAGPSATLMPSVGGDGNILVTASLRF